MQTFAVEVAAVGPAFLAFGGILAILYRSWCVVSLASHLRQINVCCFQECNMHDSAGVKFERRTDLHTLQIYVHVTKVNP
jgi:hypothetical protein